MNRQEYITLVFTWTETLLDPELSTPQRLFAEDTSQAPQRF
jgi:hypothetical protein